MSKQTETIETLFAQLKMDRANRDRNRLWCYKWLPWYGLDVKLTRNKYYQVFIHTPITALQEKEPIFDWFTRGYKKLLILASCPHSDNDWRKSGIDRKFVYHDHESFHERVEMLKRISEWKDTPLDTQYNIKEFLNSILIIITDDCNRRHYHFNQLQLSDDIKLSFFFGSTSHLKDLWRLQQF